MKNDPITEIDMSDPANRQRAIDLALAASDPEGWCEQPAEPLHALADKDASLCTVWNDGDNKEGHAVIAITGNGEHSRANAEFFASARKVVLGLISEIDRLQALEEMNEDGYEQTIRALRAQLASRDATIARLEGIVARDAAWIEVRQAAEDEALATIARLRGAVNVMLAQHETAWRAIDGYDLQREGCEQAAEQLQAILAETETP